MKKKYSSSWKGSSKARKQRKYRFNAPLHIKQKFMSSHLSKELRAKHKLRSVQLRKGDKVKIARGQFKNKTGKVDRIDLKSERVYISSIEIIKKDGSKVLYPLHPSNLVIQELNLDDKKRKEKLKETK
ncbi:MAG: 50S ribosomal protein L24 [Candidatus Woesearchaeota archaeon]